jgi:hypothetical protein
MVPCASPSSALTTRTAAPNAAHPAHAAPLHAPPSGLTPRRYLADRVLATLMTVYTFALGLVFWGAHSSPTQRAIAAASLGGLVPILLSQHSLRREQPVDSAVVAVRHHVRLPSCKPHRSGLLSAARASHAAPRCPRQPEPTSRTLAAADTRRGRFRTFMAWHVVWHVSIPSVAAVWLGHTCNGWFDHAAAGATAL